LNLEDRNALIRYRMENAWDTIKQAETLYDGKHFLGVVNRQTNPLIDPPKVGLFYNSYITSLTI